MDILDTYVHTAPAAENILDIFKGEWLSKIPFYSSEGLNLFHDERITWAHEILGPFKYQKILELGPFEGGHSYMLQKLEAANITSIEANPKAFLKCLCVKEALGLTRVAFELGDFVKFLEIKIPFDIVIASGVLYHMSEPLELLKLISKCTHKLFLWTHYYDKDIIPDSEGLRKKFSAPHLIDFDGGRYEIHYQYYGDDLKSNFFCGGNQSQSTWLTYHGILDALKQLGFNKFDLNFYEPLHPNGPAFAVCAQR